MKRDTPRPFTLASGALTITAAAADGSKLATFEGVAYTGAQMRPQGWWNDVIIDLTGVRIPSQHRPALRQHDHEQIVGHTNSVVADSDGIRVAGVFSGQREHVEKVTVPAGNGFQWQLSLGANPIRTEFLEAGEETDVNGRTVKGPLTISRETEVGEISFVPLGADGETTVSVGASASASVSTCRESSTMTEIEAKEIAKVARDAVRKEFLRCERLKRLDAEYTRWSNHQAWGDADNESGLEEAIRTGKKPKVFAAELNSFLLSSGIDVRLSV